MSFKSSSGSVKGISERILEGNVEISCRLYFHSLILLQSTRSLLLTKTVYACGVRKVLENNFVLSGIIVLVLLIGWLQ